MARGRMINTTVAEDEVFNAMSIDAQFIFMRTLPHLDRDGLITGNTTLLHSKVAPLLSEYSTKMTVIIDEWISNDFVLKYQDGKKDVLFFHELLLSFLSFFAPMRCGPRFTANA
jgi:hypothetical protein